MTLPNRGLQGAILLVLLAWTVAGCGSGVDAPAPVVPGGAVAVAPPGAPDFCSDLASADVLGDLDQAFTNLSDPALAAEAEEGIAAAANSLADLTPAGKPRLRRRFLAAADALRSLASSGRAAPRATKQVAVSLRSLGSGLQGVCRFPRG